MGKEDETRKGNTRQLDRNITPSSKKYVRVELLYGLYIANDAIELCEEVAPNFATISPQLLNNVFVVAYIFQQKAFAGL